MAELRLIDANALDALEDLEYIYHPVCDGDAWYRAEDVWKCIGEQPTIDPESLRPIGRWIWSELYDNNWRTLCCSNCFETEGARENAKYCPNCGAYMKGEL